MGKPPDSTPALGSPFSLGFRVKTINLPLRRAGGVDEA